MTQEKRDVIIEAADILSQLGGNNGLCNLQKKQKHALIDMSKKLRGIVDDDIRSEPERVPDPEFIEELRDKKVSDITFSTPYAPEPLTSEVAQITE